jgi:hypothetical protein
LPPEVLGWRAFVAPSAIGDLTAIVRFTSGSIVIYGGLSLPPALRQGRLRAAGARPAFDPIVDLVFVPSDGHGPDLDPGRKLSALLEAPELRFAQSRADADRGLTDNIPLRLGSGHSLHR